ncbi:MAG: hypothetical protein VX460_14245 [Planctomycetota bacterium]|nr:hypothetical protein [Planctomycetota bacterium]
MTRTIPRLLLVAAGPLPDGGGGTAEPAFAAERAVDVARAATSSGLEVCAVVAGSDRDQPGTERVARLAEVTGRAVHRVDARLMSVPVLQRIVTRISEGSDLCLVVAPESLSDEDPLGAGLLDLARGLDAPSVICADLASGPGAVSRVRGALRRLERLGAGRDGGPLVLAAECAAGRVGEGLAAGAREVLLTPPLDRGGMRLTRADLDALLAHARRAPSLPPTPRHQRRHARARVGIVLDECFDLYDEESLAQFEAAGAQLVPVPSFDDGRAVGFDPRGDGDVEPGELDGLIIGDGLVEAHSARLAEAVGVRAALRRLIESGAPTIAGGGGLAYLTEGIRTLSGSFHPLLGVLSGHAVAVAGALPRGHVEVELTEDGPAGHAGARLRGYAQRRWLVRGLAPSARAEYRTLSGPPDVGARGDALLALHFRPYWPSQPRAATVFVDRCLRHAARRDAAALQSGPAERRGDADAAGGAA